jgi:hypothetical protein
MVSSPQCQILPYVSLTAQSARRLHARPAQPVRCAQSRGGRCCGGRSQPHVQQPELPEYDFVDVSRTL